MEHLAAYLADGDAFSLWVVQFPELAAHVEQCLQTAERTRSSTVPGDLCAGRDALHSLYQVACQGGFEEVASLFYHCYEWYGHTLALTVL